MTDLVQSVVLGVLAGSQLVTVLRVLLLGSESRRIERLEELLYKLNRELDGIQGWRLEHGRTHAVTREGPDGLQVEIKREGSRG